MRIAVIDRDRCQPKNCSKECIKYCPRMRSGYEAIVVKEKAILSEELCIGCGICVNKCPFKAIHIENVAEELNEEMIHQFGENSFRLFKLPLPREGKVIGILGENAIGKSTALLILSGKLIPNFGEWKLCHSWDEVCDKLKGTEMHDYFEKIENGAIEASFKPQYIAFDEPDKEIGDLLAKKDERGIKNEIIGKLELKKILDKKIEEISGGDRQKLAIAISMMKDADVYFFDEPSSYLDIYNRLKVAKIIRKLSKKKMVMIVEHDLAVLDFLADVVHIIYGKKGVYGVVTKSRVVRRAINAYLSGYLKEENICFGEEIRFEAHPPRKRKDLIPIIAFQPLMKEFDGFVLETTEGKICEGEVIGILGANSLGKTTFVKMLAGLIQPTKGEIDKNIKVSYKPQYIKPKRDVTVGDLFSNLSNFYMSEIITPLQLEELIDKKLEQLSGGELQRVAIAYCLSKEADIYLIDEPSAYMDSQQRMIAAKVMRRIMKKMKKSALIVDHDVYFLDMVSDSIMVFSGDPSVKGFGEGMFDLRTGMNKFLKEVGITFRRDEETKRPRVNKIDSRLDREQKRKGEYYYEY